jgi:hypothetical protein
MCLRLYSWVLACVLAGGVAIPPDDAPRAAPGSDKQVPPSEW